MLRAHFPKAANSPHHILCLGAHCDDIEIGCGGTILKFLEIYKNLIVNWVVFSSNQQRAKEAHNSSETLLHHAKGKNIIIKDFRDGFLPYSGTMIKEFFEQLKKELLPDIIFTHYRNDLHQDHRLVSELTWNTFRDHLILEYEIPKYDGDIGSPNFFVHLDELLVRRKIECILKNYKSQAQKPWFEEETFRGILRLRGVESNAPEKYAEAFYCRKMIF